MEPRVLFTIKITTDTLFYLAVIVIAVTLGLYQNGYIDRNVVPLPIPTPSPQPTPVPPVPPPPATILVSPAEYQVVMNALEFVGNEWALSRYESLEEAVRGIDAMMGDSVHGVNRAAQERILGMFKPGGDFLGTVEEIKRLLERN